MNFTYCHDICAILGNICRAYAHVCNEHTVNVFLILT